MEDGSGAVVSSLVGSSLVVFSLVVSLGVSEGDSVEVGTVVKVV